MRDHASWAFVPCLRPASTSYGAGGETESHNETAGSTVEVASGSGPDPGGQGKRERAPQPQGADRATPPLLTVPWTKPPASRARGRG